MTTVAQANDPAKIVAAMAAGDSGRALTTFYELYASTVLALLTKMLGSRAEAEELLQEVFVELWRRAPQFQGMSQSQIADCLGLPIGTVKSRILSGMRSLRTLLPVIHAAMRS